MTASIVPAGIVTGLAAEARIVSALGTALAGGGTEAGAEAAAERLVRRGAGLLISFGLAGGLDPSARPGDLLVPEFVIRRDRWFRANAALREAIGGGRPEPLLSVGEVIADAATKRALHASHRAAACDMESGAVASVAERHGLPFAVLRAICDPAERTLPRAALIAIDHRGAIAMLRIAASVARRPAQLPMLLRVARDAAAARAALVRRVREIAVGGGLVP